MIKYYRFADMTIEVHIPEELPIPENMVKFEISESEISHSGSETVDLSLEHKAFEASENARSVYRFQLIDSMEDLNDLQARWQDAVRYERRDLIIFSKDELECRWIFYERADIPYAVCEEISPSVTMVYIMRDQQEMFIYDTIFASVFSFERRMLRHNGLLLHCAYMCLDGQAVLFSAPSGTGKSTQAELWGKYRGTRQINGDAALLTKRDGRWNANGWSICGSSKICYNETYPIRAIVMLYQSRTNSCRRLTPGQAFRKLYPQIKVNGWNGKAQEQIFNLIDDLIGNIPVYELGCDISEDAVICLEKILKQ